jgi:HSP20 family protein
MLWIGVAALKVLQGEGIGVDFNIFLRALKKNRRFPNLGYPGDIVNVSRQLNTKRVERMKSTLESHCELMLRPYCLRRSSTMYRRQFHPFTDFENLREQINQAFEPMMRTVVQEATPVFSVPFELVETSTGYTLKAVLPGVDPTKIDVQATGKSLSISAEYPEREYAKDEFVHLKELRVGKIRRTLEFDENIVTDDIQASYEFGILTLQIPKVAPNKEKTIKVEIKP